MLICHYGAVKILKEYLYKDVIKKSKDKDKCRKELLKTRKETENGVQPFHLACYLGKLDIL